MGEGSPKPAFYLLSRDTPVNLKLPLSGVNREEAVGERSLSRTAYI